MPVDLLDGITGLGLSPVMVVVCICLIYVVLGAAMETLSMILLTVPIFFPVITALGFLSFWATLGLYGQPWTVVISHAIFFVTLPETGSPSFLDFMMASQLMMRSALRLLIFTRPVSPSTSSRSCAAW